MFLNDRTKSKELIYYEVLERRCNLTNQEQWRLPEFEKAASKARLNTIGFLMLWVTGVYWFTGIYGCRSKRAILQVDSLIITEDMLIVDEIKNYSENYMYEKGVWFRQGDRAEGKDPLAQASRTAGKLIKLSNHLPYRYGVERKVVYQSNFNLRSNSAESEQFIVTRSGVQDYFREVEANVCRPCRAENVMRCGNSSSKIR